jgi:hypothetical protein
MDSKKCFGKVKQDDVNVYYLRDAWKRYTMTINV